ncbi:protein-lysine N-methyltransferase SMYD4-like isoform X3 [Oratosquilla oratoria]|uniref:protein-lysine N-methyltransferase SMYD4-like isoform X3 n=1 Tax=Oratosquilla oratoria TaxID=337810 RepID=UPI003F757C8B
MAATRPPSNRELLESTNSSSSSCSHSSLSSQSPRADTELGLNHKMVSNLKRSTKMLEDFDRPGYFKDYYKNVRKTVSNDQLNEFAKLTTDEEKFRYVFNLPAVHDIDLKLFFKGKSEKEALEKKEEGNKSFGKKKNVEALTYYSQAVIKAPVPTEECADPRKMTLYAICLANRSAALFHLKDFYHCVKDIDEALEHHYPKELKFKLFKRKGRILVTMRQHESARDAFRQALKYLDWAKMERERRLEHQTEIQRWLKMYESGKVEDNAMTEIKLLPDVPSLTGGQNEQFPSLSSKTEVKYEKGQGRFVVAAENLQIGDVICTEEPCASVLLLEQYGTHCQRCFSLTKAQIPCKKCSGVVFCSSECRSKSYFHEVECPILDLLHGSGMSINCFLAFRMLTKHPLAFFMGLREQLQDNLPETTVNNKEVYDPTDFLRIYNLVRHSQDRTPEDFFHRTVMTVFLIKALKKTKYFEGEGSHAGACWRRGDKLTEAEQFVGGLLLRFLQIIQFNAHEVSEFQLQGPRTLECAKNESLGAAIYPTLALFNHSCHSAMIRYFSGTRVITRAVRPISKGTLIPENYGPSFSTKPTSDRKAQLADRYWFDCACQPCKDNWPMFRDMDNSKLNLKCHKCAAQMAVPADTLTPFVKCDKCGDQTNILATLKNLQNTEQTFKAACKEMEAFNLEKATSLLMENLRQLDTALYPPYKDYHLTQEALMRCLLHQGNLRVMGDQESSRLSKK